MALAAATSSTVRPASRAACTNCSRCSVPAASASIGSVSSASVEPRSNPVFSMPRHALPSASLKVRPIAITSPTDFIVEVRCGSASGNFSNANRGIFTTT